ncbi:MAG: 50S ribosomal protein L15, partial [Deltaproteobacteria bacterium]
GKGHKGQKARTGGNVNAGYEGGQTPLHRRVPKRGFTSKSQVFCEIVNIERLSVFNKSDVVDARALVEKGIVKNMKGGINIKILGDGEINIPLTVRANKFSAAAREKIEAAGGKAEVI